MKNFNIKQILELIRENKMLSGIFIIGVSLAIALVMVLQIVHQIKYGNLDTEPNRDRTLYITGWKGQKFEAGSSEPSSTWNTPLSLRFGEQLYNVKSAETVSLFFGRTTTKPVYNENPDDEIKSEYLPVDVNFFKIFNLSFIEGQPFTGQEFRSGVRKAVINSSVAQKLYSSEKGAVGRVITINYDPYTVCGVVEDLSTLSAGAYSQIWIPYTVEGLVQEQNTGGGFTAGPFNCLMLAKSKADYGNIKGEVGAELASYNATLTEGWRASIDEPLEYFNVMNKLNPDFSMSKYILLISLFLLIPAINLSGLTIARMKSRISEIGVRKAFGANVWHIVRLVVNENMALTTIGGVIGLVLSFFLIDLVSGFAFGPMSFQNLKSVGADIYIPMGMLIQPTTFLYAFLYCVIINILSSIIPAVIIARKHIISAINS